MTEKYGRGALFMLAEKLTKMLTQLLMVVLLTRYFSPGEFGQLMYCYAIVSMLNFLNTLGMESILVKRFIDLPFERFSNLNHGLIIRFTFSLFCVVFANIVGLFLVDDSARLLLFVISLYHLAMPMTVYSWLYQADGRSDLSAIGLIAGVLIGFIYGLVCIFSGFDLSVFALVYVLELLISGCIYLYFSKTHVPYEAFSASYEYSRGLIKDCLPLIFSGAIVLLYMKVDQIMIGIMINQAEVGVYVAATRLSEAWYFVGLTLIGVYFPKMLKIRKRYGNSLYFKTIVSDGRWIIWGALVIAFVTSFIADYLIHFLYGELYAASAEVLIISIWAVPFVYLGAVASKMYVAESKQGLVFWRSLWGLVINIILNFFLIPSYGAVGAAFATLVSQFSVGVLFNFFGMVPGVLVVQINMLLGRQVFGRRNK